MQSKAYNANVSAESVQNGYELQRIIHWNSCQETCTPPFNKNDTRSISLSFQFVPQVEVAS